MARKTGKRGSAIIALMVGTAIAASPSTASAASGSQPKVSTSVVAPAPVLVAPAPVVASDPVLASWSEASWAEE